MKFSKQRDGITIFYLLAIIIIALSIAVLFHFLSPTGRIILDLEEITPGADAILGKARVILNKGEFIPYDSILKINLNDQNIEIPINSLILREKESGVFYIENTDLIGEGDGFGIKGTKTSYPVVYFRLKIEKTTKSSSPDVSVPEDVEETSETEEPADEKSSDLVTSQVIVSDFIDGQVTSLVDFEYELENGESAIIVSGSVNDGTNTLDDNIINLVIEDNIVKVSTDYVVEEQGFGPEYTDGEEVILEIDFFEFNITPEEGILSVEIKYGDIPLLYGEKLIITKEDIFGVPPSENVSENISEEEPIGEIIEKFVPERPTEEIDEEITGLEEAPVILIEEKETEFGIMSTPITGCGTLSSPNTEYLLQNNVASTTSCFDINADNITLDCQGYTVGGSRGNYYYGIDVTSFNNITIKNCKITNFSEGIHLDNTVNTTVMNNTGYDNVWEGFYAYCTNESLIINNNFSYNSQDTGIWLDESFNNNVSGNILQENLYDIWVGGYDEIYCSNYIENNTGSGGRPIKYYNYSFILENENLSLLLLCDADYSRVDNVTIRGSDNTNNNLIYVDWTDYVNFTNVNSSNNYYGAWLGYNTATNSNLRIINLTAKNNYNGIYLKVSNSYISNSTSDYNTNEGIRVLGDNNTIANSIFNGNDRGIYNSGDNNSFLRNYISFSQSNGIYCPNADYSLFKDNTILNTTYRGLYLDGGDHNIVDSNNIGFNAEGIFVFDSSHNLLVNNTVFSNIKTGLDYLGIRIRTTSFASVTNNTIVNNTITGHNSNGYGIYIEDLFVDQIYNNSIYNNYFNNSRNAYDSSTLENYWNTSYSCSASTLNIIGGNCTGGNYWNDYNGVDDGSGGRTVGDGIGDTNIPYNSTNNISVGGDYLPLVYLECDYYVSGCKADDWQEGKKYCLNQSIITSTNCINITNNSITFNGKDFSISGNTDAGYSGIYSEYNNITISNINIVNFSIGIMLNKSIGNTIDENSFQKNNKSIYFNNVSNSTLQNNIFQNSTYGIYTENSRQLKILDNDFNNNSVYSLYISLSSNNNVSENNIYNSSTGIYLENVNDSDFVGNKISHNYYNRSISGERFGIHLVLSENNSFFLNNLSNNLFGAMINNSNNNSFISNYVFHNRYNETNNLDAGGFYLFNSENNNFTLNNVSGNYGNLSSLKGYGFYLFNSNKTVIYTNYITNNSDYGIYVVSSSNNSIYNNYFNNTINAYDNSAIENYWNTSYSCSTSNLNIIGGNCTGGNYWNDYNGVDDGSGSYPWNETEDGIGDTNIPYNSTNNISVGGDYLPLVYFYEIYPVFSNYWDNNASLNLSGIALFNVTVINTNGSVFLQINNTNHTAENLTQNDYNVSVNLTGGNYLYYWGSWANDSHESYNVSDTRYYTVNTTPNIPPTITKAFINSSQGTNISLENIFCWVNASDLDNDYLNYSGFWYRNGEQQFNALDITFAGSITSGHSGTVDSHDNIIFAGNQYLNPTTRQSRIEKYNSSGSLLWNQSYGPIVSSGTIKDVAVDSQNNIIVLSLDYIGGFTPGYLITKYNSSGSFMWNATFDDQGMNQIPSDLKTDSNNDIVAVGGNYIVKYNSFGVYQWNKTLSGDNSYAFYGVGIDSENNILATGFKSNTLILAKLNSSNSLLWENNFGFYGRGEDIAVDSEDSILLTGLTNAFGAGDYDFLTIKLNSSGSELWNKTFGGQSIDEAYGVSLDSEENIIVAGKTKSFGAGGYDAGVVKYNSSGEQLVNFTKGWTSDDTCQAVAVDSEDNIIIFGDIGRNVGADAIFIKNYGFSSINQNQALISQVSYVDESQCFADDVWECRLKAFDGRDYTDYSETSITILSVPLYCGINITEKVTAQTNLACSETAINIKSDNVVFDCGGYQISGNSNPNTYALNINGYHNTTVQNCYISDFSDGIFMANSSDNTLTNNVIEQNLNFGIKINTTNNNIIFSNSIYTNLNGIYSYNSFGNIYSNNLLSENSNSGIYLLNSSEDTITSNDIQNNSIYGVLLTNTTLIDIENNNIESNNIGISLNNVFNNTLSSNSINYNSNSGIYVYNSNKNNLLLNTLQEQPNNIFVNYSSNNTIYTNTVSDGTYGIFLTSDSQDNLIYNNWFNNTINARDLGANYWNTTLYYNENIMEGDYIGGNFWHDYNGTDPDKDGIGDSPVPWNSSGNISGAGDWLPLVDPYRIIKIVSLVVNSTDSGNTPAGNLTCWANVTNENNNNVTFTGFWYQNDVQKFDILEFNTSSDCNYCYKYGVAVDSQDNVIIVGFSGFLMQKFNSSGSLLWSSTTYSNGRALDVSIDSQDNIIMAGWSEPNGGDILIVKYNSSGSEIWNTTFGGDENDLAYKVRVDSNDSVVVVGYTLSFGVTAASMLTVKYNSSGSQIWNKIFSEGTGGTPAYAMAIDDENSVYTLGYSTGHVLKAVKYYSNGTQAWNKTLNIFSPYYETPYGADTDSFNNVIITGRIQYSTTVDVFTIKIDKDGNVLWIEAFAGSSYDEGREIAIDSHNNIFVGGYTNSYGAGARDALLIKYDKDGNELWYKTYGTFHDEYVRDIAIDSRNNVVLPMYDLSDMFGWNPIPNYDLSGIKYYGFSLENQTPGQITNISTIPSSLISNGDAWKCEAIAFIAENYSRYKTSNELTLLYPGTTGGGAGACISSWSCTEGPCIDGTMKITCTDTKSCLTSTNLPSGCVKSGHAKCVKTVSCGEEEEEEENVTEIFPEEELTLEEEAEQISQELGCTPIFECGDWQECRVDYGFDDLVEADYINISGIQIRNCYDTTDCVGYPIEEEQACIVTVPVSLIEDAWGNETYVFVQDETTGQTVARIKLGSLFLTFMPTNYLGYYDYCFDKIQNYDETDVDCGGPNCPTCAEVYYDNFIMIKSFVLSIGLLALFFISYWTMRDLFKENKVESILKRLKPIPYKKIH